MLLRYFTKHASPPAQRADRLLRAWLQAQKTRDVAPARRLSAEMQASIASKQLGITDIAPVLQPCIDQATYYREPNVAHAVLRLNLWLLSAKTPTPELLAPAAQWAINQKHSCIRTTRALLKLPWERGTAVHQDYVDRLLKSPTQVGRDGLIIQLAAEALSAHRPVQLPPSLDLQPARNHTRETDLLAHFLILYSRFLERKLDQDRAITLSQLVGLATPRITDRKKYIGDPDNLFPQALAHLADLLVPNVKMGSYLVLTDTLERYTDRKFQEKTVGHLVEKYKRASQTEQIKGIELQRMRLLLSRSSHIKDWLRLLESVSIPPGEQDILWKLRLEALLAVFVNSPDDPGFQKQFIALCDEISKSIVESRSNVPPAIKHILINFSKKLPQFNDHVRHLLELAHHTTNEDGTAQSSKDVIVAELKFALSNTQASEYLDHLDADEVRDLFDGDLQLRRVMAALHLYQGDHQTFLYSIKAYADSLGTDPSPTTLAEFRGLLQWTFINYRHRCKVSEYMDVLSLIPLHFLQPHFFDQLAQCIAEERGLGAWNGVAGMSRCVNLLLRYCQHSSTTFFPSPSFIHNLAKAAFYNCNRSLRKQHLNKYIGEVDEMKARVTQLCQALNQLNYNVSSELLRRSLLEGVDRSHWDVDVLRSRGQTVLEVLDGYKALQQERWNEKEEARLAMKQRKDEDEKSRQATMNRKVSQQ